MNDVVVDPLGPVFPDSDTVSRIRRVAGGSGANQAAWLGYLGVRCRFIGRVGRNDADRHRSAFVAACVEPMLAVDDEVDTGTVVSIVGAERRSMYSDRGANARLGPADLPDTALAEAGLLHLSGYVLFAEPSRAAVIEFRDRAVRRGCAVSVDPSSEALLRRGRHGIVPRGDGGRGPVLPERRRGAGTVRPGRSGRRGAGPHGVLRHGDRDARPRRLRGGPAGRRAARRRGTDGVHGGPDRRG